MRKLIFLIKQVFRYGLRYVYDSEYRRKCHNAWENLRRKRSKIRRMGKSGFRKYSNVRPRFKKKVLAGKKYGFCNRCKHPFPKKKLTVDHIVQISKGGSNEKSNLQLLCGRCHIEKDGQGIQFKNRPLKDAFEKLSL